MKKLLAVSASALALLMGAVAPASAADEMGLSRDGDTFAPSLDGSLFDEDIRWVPSDVRSATFYVRNQGEATARLVVDILGAEMTELLDSGDLRVSVSGLEESATVSDSAEHRLLTLPGIADGQIVPITVTVEFDEDSTNETQLLSSDLTFRVNLRQTGAGLDDDVADDESSGLLPNTGAPAPWWVAALAAASAGGGAALLHSRRTHTQGASHG